MKRNRAALAIIAVIVIIGGAVVIGHSTWHTSPPPKVNTVAPPVCPTPPPFQSNQTYTFSGCLTVPPTGYTLRGLTNVSIIGGLWVDSNTNPCPFTKCGGGSALGRAAFTVLDGSGVTFNDLTINGANVGGFHYHLADNAGINVEGTAGVTISHVSISHVFGDALTLGALYQGVNPHVTTTPVTNAVVTSFTANAAGRQGIAAVDVNGLTASNLTIGSTGYESLDFEADTLGIGARNVTVTGAQLVAPINISSAGASTGPITISNASVTGAAGDAVNVKNLNGTPYAGPLTFTADSFRCGSSAYEACLNLHGANAITVSNSAFRLGFNNQLRGKLYAASGGTHLTLTTNTVTGFVIKTTGSHDSTSTVTVTGDGNRL